MSKEAIQEREGVRQDCLCVRRTNDALKQTYPGVKLLIDLVSGRPVVAAVRVDGKGKTPTILATFCPFCGVRYEG